MNSNLDVMDMSLVLLCNFNESFTMNDLTSYDHNLKRIWNCEWSLKELQINLEQWHLHKENLDNCNSKQIELFLQTSIELLFIFIQHNFTGPFDQLHQWEQFDTDGTLCASTINDLKENGEEINPNVKLWKFLLTAKQILQKLLYHHKNSLVINWWKLRCICIHQSVIDELAANLYDAMKTQVEWLLQHIHLLKNQEYETLLYVEVANAYLQYHRSEKSCDIIDKLCHHIKATLKVDGLLGLRTKFQQKPLPQLCLKVEHCDAALPSSEETNGNINLPKLLLLEDDTRLERIKFINPKDNEVLTLPSILQALILTKVRQLKVSTPKERLADEQLEPYVQTLLYQGRGPLWIRYNTLLFNCAQESNHRRTIERSWKQCEQMVKLLCGYDFTVQERLSYFFAVGLLPKWHVQQQLCDLLLSLGMTKTALDIYKEIQDWERVIYCYSSLDLRNKAAEVIRQELEKKPTVLLYCLLGDATDDCEYYAKAWEFSKHTSGKAQAHWGYFYFQRKQYEEAVFHLQKSVDINSLQERVWLRLGYAAIMLEKWQLAVHAYVTYTHIEPLGFESWNNLAKALIKLGNKSRAHKVLGEALKCNFHNWKIWENFMLVSVDTGHFEDAINAYNRLTDLKIQFLDLEVLCVIANALATEKPDSGGQSHERLLKKASTLMAQQCIKHGSEPKLWELAALLAQTSIKKSELLVRALRAHTAKELVWATKEPLVQKALQLCEQLCKHSLDAIAQSEIEASTTMFNSITSQLSSSRMATMACLKAIEKESVKFPQHEALIEKVNTLLSDITNRLQQRMRK